MNPIQVSTQIAALNRANLEQIEYSDLKERFAKLTEGLVLGAIHYSGANRIYRARINPAEKIGSIDGLLAPPKNLVKDYQRCNRPGYPMFYAASSRLTALKEVRAKPGDRVFMGQWVNRSQYLGSVLVTTSDSIPEYMNSGVGKILYPYFDTLFTRRIHETFSSDYKMTAALSDFLMTFIPENLRGESVSGHIALKYPSVAHLGNGSHNIVMHPDFLDQKFDLMHVMEAEVIEDEGNLSLRVIDNSMDFKGRKIIWSNNEDLIPRLKEENGTIMFVNRGGFPGLVPIDFPATPEFIRKLLID